MVSHYNLQHKYSSNILTVVMSLCAEKKTRAMAILRALKLQSASYSGRIMMSKLGSLLPVSGFTTATEAAGWVRQKKRMGRDKTISGAWSG